MKFIKCIQNLKNEYKDNLIVRENGTLLLGPNKIPNCRHMIFKPLTDRNIELFLVSEYKNSFPKEYIEILKCTNGANLYNVKMNYEGFSFSHSMFTIYGLPLTPPFGRPQDREEPFDIRVEDLARHDEIPNTWLKCGTFTNKHNLNVENDIFVDTETNYVYVCERNEKKIVDSWKSLDECFCSIFDMLADSMHEYDN